jgi:phage shock protein E
MTRLVKQSLCLLMLLLAGQYALAGGDDAPAPIKGDVGAAQQAWVMIGQGALLIDVRSPEEFAAGSIEGAVNIPYTEVDRIAELIGDELGRRVVLFCRSGGRSGKALAALEDRGYTGLFNATGYTALQATQPECVKC